MLSIILHILQLIKRVLKDYLRGKGVNDALSFCAAGIRFVKEARSRQAIAVGQEMSRAYRENMVGSAQEVLFEEPEGQFFTGHAPNYVKVYVRGENLHNEIRTVTVTGIYRDGVIGEIQM